MKSGILSSRFMILISSVVCTAACTIKEDRTPCPCILSADVTEALPSGSSFDPREGEKLYMIIYDEDMEMIDKESYDRHTMPDILEYSVPKGYVYMAGIYGLSSSILGERRLMIPAGCQSDEIYMACETVDCLSETASARLHVTKQFSRVDIREAVPQGRSPFLINRRLLVKSASAGMDILSHDVIEGEFRYEIEVGTGTDCYFRMPRQADKSIIVEIVSDDGTVYDVIPLGEILGNNGYKWDAESLSDVIVEYAPGESVVNVVITPWEGPVELPASL